MQHRLQIFIWLAVFLLISGRVFGEGNTCYDESVVVLTGVQAEHPYYNNIESIAIDVYAYLLQPFPSGFGIEIEDFNAAMDTLSSVYYGHGVSFNLVGYEYYPIDQTEYYSEDIIDYIGVIPEYPNSITMFFTDPNATRVGNAWSIPSKRFVVGGNGIFYAIAHEMGHCLGLYHTFDYQVNGHDYPWLVDGLDDCHYRGDNVCDTPAVPIHLSFGNYVDPNSCSLTQDFYDEFNGGDNLPWQPLPTNQMEYPPDGCRDQFTTDQVNRFLANIENNWGNLASVISQMSYKPTPVIASSAEFPIIASSNDTSTVIAVSVSHPNGYNDMLVTVDATNIGGPQEVILLDDGIAPDLVDNDGVYSSPPLDINIQGGTYFVEVAAYAPFAEGGNHSHSLEVVEMVAEDTLLKLVDGSASTGDLVFLMQGEPYSNAYFETQLESFGQKLLIIAKNNSLDIPDIFRRSNVVNGSPSMERKNTQWFTEVGLLSGGRGVSVADIDNDGLSDLLVCNNGSNTKLYHNTGTGYADSTGTKFSSAGIAALQGSHVAAWGDYNQDGWVDLFVASVVYTGDMSDIGANPPTSAPTWSLFRNTGVGFELTSGVLNATPTESAISATWNDFDEDGDLDLLVGYLDGSSENNPRVFENQGYKKLKGDFELLDKSSTKGIANLAVNSMDWIDYNHDEYPDLLVTTFPPQQGALLLKNVVDASGRKFVVADSLATEGQWEGASVGDLDQNGEEDIVLFPHSGIPAVYLASPGSPSPTYRERAFTLGVKPTGGSTPAFTSGGAVADFNDDHDLDLYLGRPNSDQFFYRNMRQDGTSDPPGSSDQNWIEIDLATWGNSNRSLIGSKVMVEEPISGKTWSQTVDGGSGRGGQKPNQLHFGLGAETGPVDVSVEWPSGGTADTTGVSVNTQILITETTAPVVQSGGLIFSHEPFPGGADWVFEWITTNKGDITLDTVEFRYEPGHFPTSVCTIDDSRVLSWGDSDVEMIVFPAASGWGHRVVWKGQFCSPNETCHFQFKVTSGVEGQSDSSGWVNFGYFDACLKEPQN